MLKSRVICLTRQLSIHIWIVPVSPARRWGMWGMKWSPFQGKHYCPRRTAGAEVAHISEPVLTSQHAHLQTHTYHPLYMTCVLPFYRHLKSDTDREFSITARVPGVEIEITHFLLCLTTLNSQLWVMKTSLAEEHKSCLHGFVVSCADAIIQQPQTKSCHPPGGQWCMIKERSWKHLRI